MSRVRQAAVLAAAALVLVQPRGSAQLVSTLHIQPATVDELRRWDDFVTEGERAGELRMRAVARDPMMPSRTIERWQQFHEGVPIWGADVVRDTDQGVAQSLFGELSPSFDLPVDPALPAAAGEAALTAALSSDAHLVTDAE